MRAVRLRHRRRRLGRLRARRPPVGRRAEPRAGPGIRRLRPLGPDPDAGGAVDPDEHGRTTTGATRPSPSRISAAAASTRRAARCSAARRRSTAWSTSAATRSISSAGRRRAPRGWGYRDVLPYFQRAETRAGGRRRLARRLRARSRTRYGRSTNPLYRAFVEAARQAGYPTTDDVNGVQQEGFGRMDMTVKDGVRWSAANAYLKPALKRPNLDGAHPRARHAASCSRAGAPSASATGRARPSTRCWRRPRGDPVAAARSTRPSS